MGHPRPAPHELEAFAEEAALVYGELGLPPMAGRIIGWLLVCDPPHQTQAELAKVLKASKGSISTMARLMLRIGAIQRVSLPGDRREYLRLRDGRSEEERRAHARRFTMLRQLAERGLEVLGDDAGERAARLLRLRDLNDFLERELPVLFDRFRAEQEKKGRKRS